MDLLLRSIRRLTAPLFAVLAGCAPAAQPTAAPRAPATGAVVPTALVVLRDLERALAGA